MSGDFFDQLNRTPVSYGILLVYVTMAFLTDPMNPSNAQLIRYGASVGLLVQDGESWRLLTHAFLHGGLLHLGFNAYALFLFGPALEQRLGSMKFILLYVLGAIAGGVVGGLRHDWSVPLVGGSGALFAIMGAAVALNMRRGRHLLDFLDYKGPRMLISLIVINLILGLLVPMISNAAHIGGLVAGFVLLFCFLDTGRERVDGTGKAIQAGWIALYLSLLLYVIQPFARSDFHLRHLLQEDDPKIWVEHERILQFIKLDTPERRTTYEMYKSDPKVFWATVLPSTRRSPGERELVKKAIERWQRRD